MYFCSCYLLFNCDILRGGWSRWAEHYILKGVTLRFVFGCSKLPHIECNPKQCWGDCHGVCRSDSVVCCEERVSSMHTLRVYYILLRGCLLCLFFAWVVEDLEQEQAEVKHPRFSFCSQSIVILVRFGCLRTVIVRMK